jgi:hypothetical protein
MKKLIIIVLLAALVLIIAGCGNKKILDFEYVFDYAIVRMPDGEVVTIEIDKWTDYEGERSMRRATDCPTGCAEHWEVVYE